MIIKKGEAKVKRRMSQNPELARVDSTKLIQGKDVSFINSKKNFMKQPPKRRGSDVYEFVENETGDI